jgi:hypothetical protein
LTIAIKTGNILLQNMTYQFFNILIRASVQGGGSMLSTVDTFTADGWLILTFC